METVYDWITVAIFGALVVLFLHRSVQPQEPQDHIIQYLPPSLGCMAANWVGNPEPSGLGQGVWSFVIVVAVVLYVIIVLKPFGISLKLPKR